MRSLVTLTIVIGLTTAANAQSYYQTPYGTYGNSNPNPFGGSAYQQYYPQAPGLFNPNGASYSESPYMYQGYSGSNRVWATPTYPTCGMNGCQ
jgi:hypothetical protein